MSLRLYEQLGLPRKQLNLIEPIQTAPGMQECLASFLQRLSRQHGTDVKTAYRNLAWGVRSSFNEPLVGLMEAKTDFPVRLNKQTGHTRTLCRAFTALQPATALERLVLPESSMPPLRLKKHYAWCPRCVADWKHDGVDCHIPLAWVVDGYEYCHLHHCYLRPHCAKCAFQLKSLSSAHAQGACPNCRQEWTECAGETFSAPQNDLWRSSQSVEVLRALSGS